MKKINVGSIIIVFILCSMILMPYCIGDKGKVASSFVAIQSDILEDYRYDRDVTFKIRARAYIDGIPKRDDIVITIYDQSGKTKLDTITPNPITVHAGRITEINMGHCEVGLYRATIKGQGAGQHGDLTIQWVVAYPPTDYYFSFFNVGDMFTGVNRVKAEFHSNEKYLVTIPIWDENHTEVIKNKTIEQLKPFTLNFYYIDKNGGQRTLKTLSNCTEGSWVFDDVYDSGIYCEITDIHGWVDTKWWLGARKSSAAPQYPLEKIIIGVIIIIVFIFALKHIFDWDWGVKNKLVNRRKT